MGFIYSEKQPLIDITSKNMPQLNADDAANDEPTSYNVEESEDDRWNENLNDIKGDLVEQLDKECVRVSKITLNFRDVWINSVAKSRR